MNLVHELQSHFANLGSVFETILFGQARNNDVSISNDLQLKLEILNCLKVWKTDYKI